MSSIHFIKLGEVATAKGGSGFPEIYQGGNTGIPFIKVSDMNLVGNERFINRSNNYLELHLIKRLNINVFPKDSIVFAKVGAALLLNRRRLLASETAIDNNMMAVMCHSIDANFLYHYLTSVDFEIFVQPGAVPSINQKHIHDLDIPDFTFDEQNRIAQILDSIDEQIEATEKLIKKNEDIKLGLIDSLILGDLKSEVSTPVKGNIQVLTGYPFNSQQFNGDGRGFPLLRIRDLSSSSTEIHYSGPVPEGFWVEKGDVLIGMDGEFNLKVWSGMTALLNQRVMRLRELAGSKISLKYLTYYLPSFLLDIENKTPQTTVKHLSHLSILNAEFKFPELKRQNEVAEIIDSSNCLIDAEKQNLAKLKLQKEGLMQDLLTGRVRVN